MSGKDFRGLTWPPRFPGRPSTGPIFDARGFAHVKVLRSPHHHALIRGLGYSCSYQGVGNTGIVNHVDAKIRLLDAGSAKWSFVDYRMPTTLDMPESENTKSTGHTYNCNPRRYFLYAREVSAFSVIPLAAATLY
jgi:hypothetical protein